MYEFHQLTEQCWRLCPAKLANDSDGSVVTTAEIADTNIAHHARRDSDTPRPFGALTGQLAAKTHDKQPRRPSAQKAAPAGNGTVSGTKNNAFIRFGGTGSPDCKNPTDDITRREDPICQAPGPPLGGKPLDGFVGLTNGKPPGPIRVACEPVSRCKVNRFTLKEVAGGFQLPGAVTPEAGQVTIKVFGLGFTKTLKLEVPEPKVKSKTIKTNPNKGATQTKPFIKSVPAISR